MSEHALDWLEEHKEAAQTANTFEELCDTLTTSGERMASLYKGYRWLPAYWECLKHRGFFLHKPLLLPQARCFTDLFESAVIVKQEVTKHGSHYPAPAGYVYIAEQFIAGHYGGKREWSEGSYGDGAPIRKHAGTSWYVCYVKPRFDVPAFPSGRNFSLEPGSFEAIKRDDGTLITCRSKNAIGDSWVALLDEGDSLSSLLSTADQAFLERERDAETCAWGWEAEKIEMERRKAVTHAS